MPDVVELGEGDDPRRGIDRDREVVGAANRAGDGVADLVQQNLCTLPDAIAVAGGRVGRIKRKEAGRHIGAGELQRVGRVARAVAAVAAGREVVREVCRHGVEAGRRRAARRVRADGTGLVQHQRIRRRDHRARGRTAILDREHTGAEVQRRRHAVAVGVRDGLHELQQFGARQRQRRGVIRVGRIRVPDVVELGERHDPGRGIDRDREVIGAAGRAGDGVADLVQQDLRTLPNAIAVAGGRVGRIKGVEAGRHVGAGELQRVGRIARAIAAIAAAGEAVREIRRHGVEAGRRRAARGVAADRTRLVEHKRVRCAGQRARRRAAVLDREHTGAEVERRRHVVAVRIGDGLHHLQQVRGRQGQRRGIVRIGRIGMPDVVELGERDNPGRLVDRDREVVGAASRSGDGVTDLVEHDLRTLPDAIAVAGGLVGRIESVQTGGDVRTGQLQRVGRVARAVAAIIAGGEVVGEVRRDSVEAGRRGAAGSIRSCGTRLVQHERVGRAGHRARRRAAVLDREHTGAEVERRRNAVAVRVGDGLHHLQQVRGRQGQRRGIVRIGRIGVPDVVDLGEGHDPGRLVDRDREVGRAVRRTGDGVTDLVEHDLRTLPDTIAVTGGLVGRIERIEAGGDVDAGELQRVGRVARAVATVAAGREVVREVRRDAVEAGRRGAARSVGADRTGLVQHQRIRRRDHRAGGRAAVLDREYAGADIERRRHAVAVRIDDGLHHLQQIGARQRQRRRIVRIGWVGVPDIVELGECHDAGRGIDRDREVIGAASRAGDRITDLVQQNLRALPDAVAVGGGRIGRIKCVETGRHIRAGEVQRVGRVARAVAAIAAGREVVGEVCRHGIKAGRRCAARGVRADRPGLVEHKRVSCTGHRAGGRAAVLDREHTGADIERRRHAVAVRVGDGLHHLQQAGARQRQRCRIVRILRVRMPDVVRLREGDDTGRRINRDGEIRRPAGRAGDRVAGLVEDDLRALSDAVAVSSGRVGRIQRVETRGHIRAGELQRVGRMAGSVAAVAAGREVVGEVRRHAGKPARRKAARRVAANRARLVQHQRFRRPFLLDHRAGRRTAVLNCEHAATEVDRRCHAVAVHVSDGLHHLQQAGAGEGQRRRVIRVGRIGMPDVVDLGEGHDPGRLVDRDREVDRAVRRAGDGVTGLVQHDLRTLPEMGRVGVGRIQRIEARGHVRAGEMQRVGSAAGTVGAVAAAGEIVGEVRRHAGETGRRRAARGVAADRARLIQHQRVGRAGHRARHRTIVKDRQMRADIDARTGRLIVVVSHGGGQRDQTRRQRDPFIEVARCCLMNRAQIGQRHMTRTVNRDREDQIATDRRAPFHDAGRVDRQQNVLTGRRIDQTGIFVGCRDRQRIGQRLLAARYRDVERHLHRRDRCPCGSEPRTGDTMVGGRGQEALVDNQRRQGIAGNDRRRSNAQHEAGRRRRGHEVRQLFLRRQHVGRHRS